MKTFGLSLGTLGEGLGEFEGALADLNPAARYYQGILSTSGGVDEVLGPEREAIAQNYQNIINSISRTAPRGGGRTSSMANFEFDKMRQLMDLIPKARTMAAEGVVNTAGARMSGAQGITGVGAQTAGVAQGMTGVGGARAGLGLGASNVGLGAKTAAGQNFSALLGNTVPPSVNLTNQGAQNAGDLGDLIGGFLGPILSETFSKIGGKKAA